MQRRNFTLVLAVLLVPGIARAELTLASLFSDSTVLQRNQPAKVWGWSDAGAEIEVAIADQKKSAVADDSGRWSLKLDPMPAGGPHELLVSGDGTRRTVRNVLFGDVWLCSGQSNMAMTVSRAKDFEQEASAANFPEIRMFKVNMHHDLEPQQTCDGSWTVCSPATVGGFSATAYFFGRRLHQEVGVPIGLINSSVGGTSVESWTSMPAQSAVDDIRPRIDAWNEADREYDAEQEQATYNKSLQRWKKQVEAAKASGKTPPRGKPKLASRPRNDRNYPSRLFNGMIHPLIGYTIKGAIWYQGENSSGRGFAHLYGSQLSTLIRDWRDRWGQGAFPFAWVQLPNFRRAQPEPVEVNGWSLVQEGMLKTLAMENTGMAVTIDVGEADNIHPKDKQTVGERLARWALAEVYGKPIISMGPIYRGSTFDGNEVIIEFDHAEGLKATTKKVEGFAICGEDRKFVRARARIKGDKVIVSSPEIETPVSVRYAWAANPVISLVNEAGLPASPFRTDNWEERGK